MQSVSQEEQKSLVIHQAKNNLIDYAIAIDPNYQDTWFHESLAVILQSAMESVENGKDARIIVEAPPRHGKSNISTIKFASWLLGHHPDWPIVVASYSSELAVKFGQETRDLMNKPAYQEIFTTRLSADTKAKGYWKTSQGGSYFSAGAGGAFTGSGFKIGIVDDIFKNREEAESIIIRDSRWDWFRSTFYTRQEGASAIIIINTRWHTDDLVGRLRELEAKQSLEEDYYDKWNVISFPAIATRDELHRKEGEPLWPGKFSLEKLRLTENTLGPYEFAALYQCNPITSENQEFKPEWLQYRRLEDIKILNTRKFATLDTGGKGVENDYTGIIRNYVDEQNNWNIEANRLHIGADEIINLIFQLYDEGFEEIGIEETMFTKAIEPFFIIECRKRNQFPKITMLKHGGRNKEVRIRGLVPRYKAGAIFHIQGACAELEKEMLTFPKGIHDDTIDALAYQNDIAKPPMNTYAKAQMISNRLEKKSQIRSEYGL